MGDKFNILEELKDSGAVALLNTDNKNYFSVPDNYFDNLASEVLENVFIKSLPTGNPYSVPGSYFKHLPNIILDKINMTENFSPVLAEKNLYTVPDGYFDSLADNILKKIRILPNPVQEELEEISPFLNKIPKINVYTIPENYFEEFLPLAVVNYSKPKGKVISIGSKTRKWIGYAAAACIASVLLGGGYFYLENQKNYTASSLTNTDIQKQISLLSDDEIANYLEENNNIGIYTNTGEDDYHLKNLNIQNMLQNVSDEEIQQYLNENAELVKDEVGI